MDAASWAIANIGPGAVVLGFVLAILSGRLVPRRVLEDRMSDKELQIARAERECRDLRAATDAQRETIDLQVRQINELSEVDRVARAVLAALPKAAER